jgi:hypothetical protein
MRQVGETLFAPLLDEGGTRRAWFRDLDSNQDTQLQRLMSYQLDDPGMARRNCSRGCKQRRKSKWCHREEFSCAERLVPVDIAKEK